MNRVSTCVLYLYSGVKFPRTGLIGSHSVIDEICVHYSSLNDLPALSLFFSVFVVNRRIINGY